MSSIIAKTAPADKFASDGTARSPSSLGRRRTVCRLNLSDYRRSWQEPETEAVSLSGWGQRSSLGKLARASCTYNDRTTIPGKQPTIVSLSRLGARPFWHAEVRAMRGGCRPKKGRPAPRSARTDARPFGPAGWIFKLINSCGNMRNWPSFASLFGKSYFGQVLFWPSLIWQVYFGQALFEFRTGPEFDNELFVCTFYTTGRNDYPSPAVICLGWTIARMKCSDPQDRSSWKPESVHGPTFVSGRRGPFAGLYTLVGNGGSLSHLCEGGRLSWRASFSLRAVCCPILLPWREKRTSPAYLNRPSPNTRKSPLPRPAPGSH